MQCQEDPFGSLLLNLGAAWAPSMVHHPFDPLLLVISGAVAARKFFLLLKKNKKLNHVGRRKADSLQLYWPLSTNTWGKALNTVQNVRPVRTCPGLCHTGSFPSLPVSTDQTCQCSIRAFTYCSFLSRKSQESARSCAHVWEIIIDCCMLIFNSYLKHICTHAGRQFDWLNRCR